MQAQASTSNHFLDELIALAGAAAVVTDEAERAFYSQDIYRHGATVSAILKADSVDMLQKALRLAHEHEIPVIMRGGGMSYTDAYLAKSEDALIIDSLGLNKILEVNTDDMYVTVEAGVTWRELADTLKPHGVRTPYWGPLSGMRATVGGAMSQGSVFLGSGKHGSAADNVQSMDILLADGTLVRTGSATNTHATPFYRNFGPDLTGLFTGDCGALGVKVRATLPLKRLLPATRHASFGFKEHEEMIQAMAEIAREDIVSECFAFDPGLQKIRLKRASISEDVKSLGRVVKASGNLFAGIKAGAKVVAAGRDFLKDLPFSLHVTLDARTEEAADEQLEAVRRIAANGGKEVEATMPTVMRADPFANVNSMLGPGGERWVPVHGIFAMSRAIQAYEAFEAVFDKHQQTIDAMNIEHGTLICSISSSAILVEPCLYWEDEQMTIHQTFLGKDYISGLERFPRDEKAREFIDALREELTDVAHKLGATHFQIGKHYPYREDMQAGADRLITAIKQAVDANGQMNPGALGFD